MTTKSTCGPGLNARPDKGPNGTTGKTGMRPVDQMTLYQC